ncbi:hypothetical protein B0H63DRAFT_541668 [Podospora didyma]|uniref:DUF1996 domain-containing protein n=1 Tax=Podospora didyma TaxID=330526 RepID=A0AAE0NTG8_9PEZI|nr:hypothetical protein B0H63DRAFT_541668 [Podospora didyma]
MTRFSLNLLPTALLAVLPLAQAEAEDCDYGDYFTSPCLNEPPTLVYAIDELSVQEKDHYHKHNYNNTAAAATIGSSSSQPNITLTATSLWLEFPETALNFTPKAETESQLAAFFTNATSVAFSADPGSTNCTALLGSACAQNLRQRVAPRIAFFGKWDAPTYSALYDWRRYDGKAIAANLSCPLDMFDSPPALFPPLSTPVLTGETQLKRKQMYTAKPFSGNASHAHTSML